MAIDELAAHRSDDIGTLVGNDDGLASHRTRLISGGARLHNLLKMRRQVNDRASIGQFCLVCIDL